MTAQRIVVAYILVATDVQQLWRKEGGKEGEGGRGRRGREEGEGRREKGEKGRSLRVLTHKLMSI